MREVTHKCDNCGTPLNKKHLSIHLVAYSGVKDRNPLTGYWEHTTQVQGVFGFCSGECVADFMNIERLEKEGGINYEVRRYDRKRV